MTHRTKFVFWTMIIAGALALYAVIPAHAGNVVTVMGPGSLVRTGYSFASWNTAPDGSGVAYSPGATFSLSSLPPSGVYQLFAQWQALPPADTYSVVYIPNQATSGAVPVDSAQYTVGGAPAPCQPGPTCWVPFTGQLFPSKPLTASGSDGQGIAVQFVADATFAPNGVTMILVDESPNPLAKDIVISSTPNSFTPFGGSQYCQRLGVGSYAGPNLRFGPAQAYYDCPIPAGSIAYANVRGSTPGVNVLFQLQAQPR